jgi:hypothetical protein
VVRVHLLLRGALLAAILSPTVVRAQDDGTGGVLLTFGFSERLEASTNRALQVESPGNTLTSDTTLAFGLLTETATSSLAFDLSGALRLTAGPGGGDDAPTFADPFAALTYTRQNAGGSFELRGQIDQTDIGFARQFADFINEDGTISLPEDFNDLFGTGIRQSSSVFARLVILEDAPLGFTFSAGAGRLSYFDTTDPELVDSTNSRAGATARLDLTDVTRALIGVNYATSTEEDSDPTATTSLDAGLAFTRPNGNLTFGINAADSESGTRLGFRLGRDGLVLPRGSLDAGIGATRNADGAVNLTGDLFWRNEMPWGSVTATLSQDVTSNDIDNTEELVSIAALRLVRAITPTSAVTFDLAYVDSSDSSDDSRVRTSSFVATYDYALTENWGVNLGYRYRQQDNTDQGVATENAIFLTLDRLISVRP